MNIQVIGEKGDASYASNFSSKLRGHKVWLTVDCPFTITSAKLLCGKNSIKGVICANEAFLRKLSGNAEASLWDYAGSMFTMDDIEVVIVPPIASWHKIPEYPFLFEHYVTKLTNPEQWPAVPNISWEVATPDRFNDLRKAFATAKLIAIDIETSGMLIDEAGFTAVWQDANGKLSAHAIVVPVTDSDSHNFVKAICENPVPKVMQNGCYDASHFLVWDIKIQNWLFDTYHAFHSWYAELPKDLGFIAAFCVRNFKYWKHEKHSGSKHDEYFYNAKDTWTTAFSAIYILSKWPDWAFNNFTKHEFPTMFPALQCSMEGLKIDETERQRLITHYQTEEADALAKLAAILATPTFNPNSPVQVVKVLKLFGGPEFTSSDKKSLAKFKHMHPLNAYIVELITKARGAKKLVGTYLNAPLLFGRLMYKLDVAGTGSGRLASKKSHFGQLHTGGKGKPKWVQYGAQIQNFTPKVKSMCIADDGWLFAEIDNSQSESRCTAYISEDENLIQTVETSPDFHCTNASLFFGIPFEKLFDVATGEKLDKPLRDLAKRVNHGANYNMGPGVLLDTMGIVNVINARTLLGLPANMKPLEVCAYLLSCFDKAYPKIRGKYYGEVVSEIHLTNRLTGASGWTRWCFQDPAASKLALNAYVAHPPQSLSVMDINRAFRKCWYKFQIQQDRVRFVAQIHDSLFIKYRPGDEDVLSEISQIMAMPVKVKGREMIIPNDIGCGKTRWSELK